MTFATATLTTFDVQILAIQEKIAELQAQLSEVQSRRQSAQAIEQMGQSAIDQVLAMLGSCDHAGFPELKDAFVLAIKDVIAGNGPIAFLDAGEPEPEPTPPAPSSPSNEPILTVDISAPTVEQFAASAQPAATEKPSPVLPAKEDKKPTISEVKAIFAERFGYGHRPSKEIDPSLVRQELMAISDSPTDARALEVTGKKFWIAALRIMDRLAATHA